MSEYTVNEAMKECSVVKLAVSRLVVEVECFDITEPEWYSVIMIVCMNVHTNYYMRST